MITGLKTVHGGKSSEESAKSGLHRRKAASVDLAHMGVSVDVGPEVATGREEEAATDRKGKIPGMPRDGSDAFVLAFKVSKLKISRGGQLKKEEEYLTGAFM